MEEGHKIQVGRYIYNKGYNLGDGAFGRVYKGYDKNDMNKLVAVKVIDKDNVAGESMLGTPINDNEVKILKILKKIDSPNIVRLLAHEDTYYSLIIITEFCNGGNLADYLNRHGKLTNTKNAVDHFLFEIAQGMRVIYSLGIIHRDLKPENILLHSESNNPYSSFNAMRIKIADFGLATILPSNIYFTYTQLGTPLYMAPEIVLGLHYDAKVDLWSIGMILYNCITGDFPITVGSIAGLRRFYSQRFRFNISVPDAATFELVNLLEKLLTFNPEDRMDFGEFFSTDFSDMYHIH